MAILRPTFPSSPAAISIILFADTSAEVAAGPGYARIADAIQVDAGILTLIVSNVLALLEFTSLAWMTQHQHKLSYLPRVYSYWQAFTKVALDRLAIKRRFDSGEHLACRACENMETIWTGPRSTLAVTEPSSERSSLTTSRIVGMLENGPCGTRYNYSARAAQIDVVADENHAMDWGVRAARSRGQTHINRVIVAGDMGLLGASETLQ
ncbi:hypothetical protein FB451DRAFT_1565016 [Mycena latifolia]|nr:hypothetical protein FB451DRAFT_1565016 [Mycena latifolia]